MQHPYIKYEQDKTWTVVNDLINDLIKPVGGINQQIKYQKYECKKVAHVAKNQ